MSRLELQLEHSLRSRQRNSKLTELKIDDPNAIDYGTNDFLGLSRSKKMRDDYLNELQSMSQILGSVGSRILTANSKYVEDLERYIANFHQSPSALLFNSGFDANVSLFSTLPQSGDIIFYDELIHASTHEGMRNSRAKHRIPFAHSNVSNLALHLEKFKDTTYNVFIAVETVYSMDGDVAPLTEIVALIRSYWPNGENGHLIVDEAHSTGVFGDHGRGIVQELKLEDKVFARLHTFSKAMASGGAVVLGSETLRQFLVNYARPFIFSTYMSYSSLALVKTAYRQLESDEISKTQMYLQSIIRRFRDSLASLPIGTLMPSTSPIQGIILSGNVAVTKFAEHLNKNGFLVKAIRFPIVQKGRERVRICLHAHNSIEQIDDLVKSIHEFLRNYYMKSKM